MKKNNNSRVGREPRSQRLIHELMAQAKQQAQLERTKVLPSQLEGLARLIARYSWQMLIFVSGCTAAIVEWAL